MSCISSSKYSGLEGTDVPPGWEGLAVLAVPLDPRLGITNACMTARWESRVGLALVGAGAGVGAGSCVWPTGWRCAWRWWW